MILIISNSKDVTTDYMCGRFNEESLKFVRINSDQIFDEVRVYLDGSCNILEVGQTRLPTTSVSSVIFRRPKPLDLKIGRDLAEQNHVNKEWSEAIEGYLACIDEKKWFNHPANNVRASHKVEQLSRATSFGLRVPRSLVTQDKVKLQEFWEACGERIIVKPLALGFLERQPADESTQIYTNLVSREKFEVGMDKLINCPTFFQEAFIQKTDVRITVIDGHVYAVAIKKRASSSDLLDIRRDNMINVEYENLKIPESIQEKLLLFLRSYQLRYAAVDMIIDEKGDWIFLEINPNGQWAWMDIVGVTKIYEGYISSLRQGQSE